MRSAPAALAALFLLAAVGCKRGSQTDGDGGAPAKESVTRVEPVGGGPANPSNGELLPGATCRFPGTVDEDLTLAAGCVVDVIGSALVANGKTLTIEPGVRLRFHEKAFLEIGHKGSRLIARGEKDRPIVFTSASATPRAGDWIGVVFDGTVGEGTTLEHAIIEYAGRKSHGGEGALTVFRAFSEPRVAIRDVTFQHNATAAVANPHSRTTFAAFERNVLRENERGMRVTAGMLAALGEGNDIDDAVEILGGTVTGRGTWPASKGGYLVTEPVYVNGDDGKPASLTIARGAVLRFAPQTWLEVGTGGPAELSAVGVTFTSAAESPAAGDWVGLFFGDKTKRAVVADSTIEYAGAEEHGSDAAVTFVGDKSWQQLEVYFTSVSFRSLKQAHFSSNGDGCNKALDPKHGIRWAGIEPCR